MALAILVAANPRVMKKSARCQLGAGKWRIQVIGDSQLSINLYTPEQTTSFTVKHHDIVECKVVTPIDIVIAKAGNDNEIYVYAEPC